jgi:hypothetical protein
MRIHLSAGDQKTISQIKPIVIKGFLIATDDQNDATLTITDANGDVLPVGGFRVQGNVDYGGLTTMHETCDPAVVAELQGTGSSAIIYYEEIPWQELAKFFWLAR